MRRFAALFIPFLIFAAACSSNEPVAYAGYQRSPLPDVGEHVLPDADGGEFSLAASSDNVLLVYFGYTSCPDVCPTTLSDVRSALTKIEEPERIELAMVTVDPLRDTNEVMAAYVQSFVPGAHGLRTEDDTILRAAADDFGADYDVGVADDGEPEVAHTGSLYAVDASGKLLLTWPFGTSSADIAADLGHLLEGSA